MRAAPRPARCRPRTSQDERLFEDRRSRATARTGAQDATDIQGLDAIVAELRRSREVTHNIREGGIARRLPSSTVIAEIVAGLSAVLFPTHYGQPELTSERIDGFVRGMLEDTLAALEEQVRRAHPLGAGDATAERDAADRVARDIVAAFAGAASRDPRASGGRPASGL